MQRLRWLAQRLLGVRSVLTLLLPASPGQRAADSVAEDEEVDVVASVRVTSRVCLCLEV